MSTQPAQPRAPSRDVRVTLISAAIFLVAAVWPAAVPAGAATELRGERAPASSPATTAPTPTSPAGPYEYVGSVDGVTDCDHTSFSRDGSMIVTYQSHGDDRFARVWDTRTLTPLTNALPHQ